MSDDAITNYKNKLGVAKAQADTGVRTAINSIAGEVISAVQALKMNSQTVNVNIDEIITDLNIARDEWLASVKGVFDIAINGLRDGLKKQL